MKRFWAFYMLLPVLLLTALFASGFAGSIAAAPGTLETDKLTVFEVPSNALDPNETLRLINRERAITGLKELSPDEKLAQVAKARADDMVARQYYSHQNPDGRYYYDYFSAYSVSAGYTCENLNLVFVPVQEQVANEWMASANGHRACILNSKITHAGYSTAKLTLVDYDGAETTAYLVVAIHAEQ